MSGLVSIAMCTFNGEAFIAEQLNSIRQQSYSNLEIIIVDDCSTDNTYNILQEHAASDIRIKLFANNVNLGFRKNFEKAVSLCTADYIALADQDDIWDVKKIENQVESIGDHILVYHDSEFVLENGNKIGKKMSDVVNMVEGCLPYSFILFNCISGHSILAKKYLFEKALPFPETFYHDKWLAYCAGNLGTIKYLPNSYVKYRQHPGSDTNILKLQRSKNTSGKSAIQKVIDDYQMVEICKQFSDNKDPKFIHRFATLYHTRLTKFFSFELFTFFLNNQEKLLQVYKKSVLSKLNYSFKHSWGVNAKRFTQPPQNG